MKLDASFIVLVIALGAAGCVTPASVATTRASNDMNCPEDKVVVRNIGGSSFRAAGCSQEATYNCVASGTGEAYVCQREEQKTITTGAPEGAPPPPPPPPPLAPAQPAPAPQNAPR